MTNKTFIRAPNHVELLPGMRAKSGWGSHRCFSAGLSSNLTSCGSPDDTPSLLAGELCSERHAILRLQSCLRLPAEWPCKPLNFSGPSFCTLRTYCEDSENVLPRVSGQEEQRFYSHPVPFLLATAALGTWHPMNSEEAFQLTSMKDLLTGGVHIQISKLNSTQRQKVPITV